MADDNRKTGLQKKAITERGRYTMSNLYTTIPSQMKGKTLMITGGTGSFGSTVLNRFLTSDIGEIRIFSRDEKKQDDMRHEYQVRYPEYADKISVLYWRCKRYPVGDVMQCTALILFSMPQP